MPDPGGNATLTLARRRSVLSPPLRLYDRQSVMAWTSGRVRTIGSSWTYTAATERGGVARGAHFPDPSIGFSFIRRLVRQASRQSY